MPHFLQLHFANMLQVNSKILCFISFVGLNGVYTAKNYQGHHQSGYEQVHPVDENQISVSWIKNTIFKVFFKSEVVFQTISNLMNACYQKAPEETCLRMIFNDDTFWSK